MNEASPITELKGIGGKTAEKFAAAGIHTLGDLIHYYPRDYESFDGLQSVQDLTEGALAAVMGTLMSVPTVSYAGRFKIVNAKVKAGEGLIGAKWFNMPYLRASLVPGKTYVLRGQVKSTGKTLYLSQPQIFSPEEYQQLSGRLKPVYPLVQSLKRTTLEKAVRGAFAALPPGKDFLPEEVLSACHLQEEMRALWEVHFPENRESLVRARNRLVFDEFLLFILGVKQLKGGREQTQHSYVIHPSSWAKTLIEKLPYRLTGAQMHVWQQLEADLTDSRVMARLVQGDVGSGKTILAYLSMLTVAESGGQSALMVPTAVLARQHYDGWQALKEVYDIPWDAVLLTGAMTAREKREAYARIASGEVRLVIGTHALFQEKVNFASLMLVITDEQHRFGVLQRQALGFKGELPHTLVMSATPIPRTLAVILYGDLDISIIDEMPANRLPIKTAVVDTHYRPKAYRFIEKQVREGRQAYVICPLVESSEAEGMENMENVLDYTKKLREALPADIAVEMLHGRMKQQEKDDIMGRFAAGSIHVLVSTTVIEVGVNVPNATVMMIEDAQRFGLAQLHQLRGRVGRGAHQSYCILVYPGRPGQENAKPPRRLMVLKESDDGFVIAQKDLEMRGPGDLFGVRQSGDLAFDLADIYTDASVMEKASETAEDILNEDPELELPKYSELKKKITRTLENSANNLNI